ncbi:MAG: cation transporter [Sulfuricurvum sp. PC08-66]|nr:MAG: cation transporter [Sulfuricurvum sp. PC08-66]
MIASLIRGSIRHPFVVLFATVLAFFGSWWAILETPLDVLPDLSPPQVIVQLTWAGQSADIVEEQATYAVVSQLLTLPRLETARGFSSYENGLIYLIFEEGTDLYWARSRVQESLSAIVAKLPKEVAVALGPDASGVGWVYEYTLSSTTQTLQALRTYQEYTLRNALLSVSGVSDVATVGGFVPNYQITLDNYRLIEHNLSIGQVVQALKANHNDTGGKLLLENGFEWMIQAKGRAQTPQDLSAIVITQKGGIPLTLGDIGRVESVPQSRRGTAYLDDQGQTVGGIVMMRYDANAYATIEAIKAKLATLTRDDITLTSVYDRSTLIDAAIATLSTTLLEESIIVLLVVGLFLWHLPSAFIVLVVLPLTVGVTFLMMKLAGVGSNIMSLGGIAIAIGAMVDAAIVLIENSHARLHEATLRLGRVPTPQERTVLLIEATQEVGRPIFFALMVVVLSFLPLFFLNGQEGALFAPLAFTKSFAMITGAFLAITLVPVLIAWLVKPVAQKPHKIGAAIVRGYGHLLRRLMAWRYGVLALTIAFLLALVPLYQSLKWEFMPMLDEQSIMYMPVTPYGIGIDQAQALLEQTNKILMQFPEVEHVFGKAGRANTATDPAPLGMIESIITLKSRDQWRPNMTPQKLRDAMEEALQIGGLVNSWTYPIRGRIDMLLSGIRTPIGIKLYGDESATLEHYAKIIEEKLRQLEMTQSVFADQAQAGYYLTLDIDEKAVAAYGTTKEAVLQMVRNGIGGATIDQLYSGIERYDISVRLEEHQRDSIEAIRALPLQTARGFVPLEALARIDYETKSSIIKTEMGKRVSYIYITPREGITAQSYVQAAQEIVESITLPQGTYWAFAGQSQYLESAWKQMRWVIGLVVALTLLLIYWALLDGLATLIIASTLWVAMAGGILLIYWLDFAMSIAVVVGFLALLGVAAQAAIVMVIFIKERLDTMHATTPSQRQEAIIAGATSRLRPKLMTVVAIIAGLVPIMLSHQVGSEVMQRIAAPMIGGVATSALLSLILIPVLYAIALEWRHR